MHTKIKICGIKDINEIEFINQMDIDYIGFVFAKSIRQIDVDQARLLSNALKDGIKKVGVFVDHSVAEINSIVKNVGLDIVQVHKNYTQDMIADIQKPVWYGIGIKDENSIALANKASKYKNVAAIVTDTYIKGMEGGTGKAFNWDMLSGISQDTNLVLAGGLNAENIESAIATVHPQVVDVSSGVETTENGITMKSKDKIEQFLRKARK
ncbi:MAG: phosphoribosylanthranilate isomerase [Eubacteriales bacterium]